MGEYIESIKVKDSEAEDLDALVYWGLNPIRHFVDVLGEELSGQEGEAWTDKCTLAVNEIRGKLEDITDTIERWNKERALELKNAEKPPEPTLTEQFVLWKLQDMTPGVQRLVGDFIDWAIENGGNGKKANLLDLHTALKQFSYDAPERLRDSIGKQIDVVERSIHVCLRIISEHKEKIIPTDSSEETKEKAPEQPTKDDPGA